MPRHIQIPMQDQKILRTAESDIPPKYTEFLYSTPMFWHTLI